METTDRPSTGGSEASRPKPPYAASGSRPTGGYSGGGGGYKPRSGGYSAGGGGGGGGRGGRPPARRRLCRICADKQGGVDWKAVNFLRNFVTERGKMLSGRATGTCSRCQRQLTRAIKRARNIALVPTSPF